jgi:hypothetical protein
MRRIPTLIVATALASGLASADVIVLKGGGRIEGDVVEQRADRVVIDVPAGRVTLPRTLIESMVVGSTSLGEFRARAASLAPRDVEGWLALAAWARDHELRTQSRGAYEHVLALDPANAAAHQALGHVFVAGQWLTRDEAYRTSGFVQFEGHWVRPEAQQAMLEERAADAAARRDRIETEARIREAEARARTAEAEARRAEADAARADQAQDGIPYPYVFGGGFGGGFVPEVFPPDPPPPPPPSVVVIESRPPQRDGNHRRHGGSRGHSEGGSSAKGKGSWGGNERSH